MKENSFGVGRITVKRNLLRVPKRPPTLFPQKICMFIFESNPLNFIQI